MFGQTNITLSTTSGKSAEVEMPFLSIELLFKEN